MDVSFWGVRGCIVAPGEEFNEYGGNTPCVSVRTAQNDLLILDAGTGIIGLGESLMMTEFGKGGGTATILLTHAHWDHIQGFPFFIPLHVQGNRFVIHGGAESPHALEHILEGQMSPHFSPLHGLRNLRASIELSSTGTGVPIDRGAARIASLVVPHGPSESLAFRIEARGRSLVYAPDVGYDVPSQQVLDFYQGADCLIHDCTYTPEDRAARRPRGYSSIEIAAQVAVAARVRRLVMFHYDQDYTDPQVDELERSCRKLLDAQPGGKRIGLTAAREGMLLSL